MNSPSHPLFFLPANGFPVEVYDPFTRALASRMEIPDSWRHLEDVFHLTSNIESYQELIPYTVEKNSTMQQ